MKITFKGLLTKMGLFSPSLDAQALPQSGMEPTMTDRSLDNGEEVTPPNTQEARIPASCFVQNSESPNMPLCISTIGELILKNQYKLMNHLGIPTHRLDEMGYAIYSESDEDGILNLIFSLIGISNKMVVDIGAAAIDGSNSANLIINHGWTGLLIEASEQNVQIAQSYYASCRGTKNYQPKVINGWVTAENVNQILDENGINGEIDLLCIDIDGIDYWIWKAINSITPRVVVVEYQCIWGPEKSVTVPYNPQFKGGFAGQYGIYSGASLSAFVKLGVEKGYRLVGCQKYGYNAFFIRNDLGQDILPEVSPLDCFRHPFTSWAIEKFLPLIKDREWVEI